MNDMVDLSPLDFYLINKVKALRKKKGMSQAKLSLSMGLAKGFISKVENPRVQAKYSVKHLNLLANGLNCTIWELLPEVPV